MIRRALFVCLSAALAVAVCATSGSALSMKPHPISGIALDAVACPTATSCVAVGADEATGDGVVVVIDHGRPQPAQVVSSTAVLSGVACLTATLCDATTSNAILPIENGAPGAPMPLPVRAGENWELSGIACGDSSTCVAVGQTTNAHTHPMAVTVHDQKVHNPMISDAFGFFRAVSCPATLVCFAVGDDGYAAIYAGRPGTEGAISAGNPTGISCVSRSRCEIVGDGSSHPGFIESLDKGALGAEQDVDTVNSLDGVTCVRLDCVAVGLSGDSGALLNIHDGVQQSTITVDSGNDTGFNAIAHLSAANYEAVGDANILGSDESTIYKYQDPCPNGCA
jgi:hypothetical protein